MRFKLLLTLIWTLSAAVIQAADNVVVLKANDGQTVTLEYALARQSDIINDMYQSGLLELQLKDEAGNPVLGFEDLDINLLRKVPELLRFAQQYPINFPINPTLQERKKYQDDIEKIVSEFNKLYLGKGPYTDIFKIAQFFDIPVIKQILGQLKLSPDLDLKTLEQHAYISSSNKLPIDPEFQDWVTLQLKRRIDLEKERYFAGEVDPQDEIPYFKGVSVQDHINYGRNLLSQCDDDRLDLSRMALNSVEGLEELFDKVGPIRVLDLGNNELTTIPSDIRGIGTVEALRLNNNKIQVIPSVIVGLEKLKTLDLSSNRIQVIPSAIAGLEELEILGLSSNRIQVIPSAIVGLEKLKTLDLSYNQITEFPTTVSGLDSLENLDLKRNRITGIPATFKGLDKLEWLNLESNGIREIPSTLTGLNSLSWIRLHYNKITDVPENITGLPLLERLELTGNPITLPTNYGQPMNPGKRKKIESLEQSLSNKRAKKEEAIIQY